MGFWSSCTFNVFDGKWVGELGRYDREIVEQRGAENEFIKWRDAAA